MILKCEINDATHFEHPSDLVSFQTAPIVDPRCAYSCND